MKPRRAASVRRTSSPPRRWTGRTRSRRAREKDIPQLVAAIVERLEKERGFQVKLVPGAVRFLQEASWPGHIRELEGMVETVVRRR